METAPGLALAPGPQQQDVEQPAPGRAEPPAVPLTELLLVDTPKAATLCDISEATWHRLKSAGKTPAPLRLGACTRYRTEDLRLWVQLGCPDRRTFEARKAAR